ncbi:hypothetical protein WA026_023820 [Henosepilachna vigintioctopunctata]|uniref:Uncharacterized protein n=1 Tax=Henosepilachna vigintioctopunctata TaxID=420089 RepID=A0AAW1UQX9_9CUCU
MEEIFHSLLKTQFLSELLNIKYSGEQRKLAHFRRNKGGIRSGPEPFKWLIDASLLCGPGPNPLTTVENIVKYLGLTYTATGVMGCSVVALDEQPNKILRARLKPAQKLQLVESFPIPSNSHSMQSPAAHLKNLRKRTVR